MFASLGWQSLHTRRTKFQTGTYIQDSPIPGRNTGQLVSLLRGRNICDLVTFFRTDLCRQSFLPAAIRLHLELAAAAVSTSRS
ncbi:hypothetical protein DPMN_048747 [Dreissena polymorpha]|uniref:Uncharacterized protein n=1 Tax=Dreissena polymorpha TaxID=45954 RepID=A0A9D4DC48_DREPO|nr:hypothetical protein DPMN_048747 [Dreissena polymorpha]